MNGIQSVQTNSPVDARYDRKEASDGRPFFNLKAGNHQIIGTSQMYKDRPPLSRWRHRFCFGQDQRPDHDGQALNGLSSAHSRSRTAVMPR